MKYILIYILVSAGVIFTSCKKFIEVDTPDNQLISSDVFTNDATATSATVGIYQQMTNNLIILFNGGLSLYSGLSSDELVLTRSDLSLEQFSTNSVLPNLGILKTNLWDQAYKFIYQANLLLEGLKSSSGVSASLQKQLRGEALFVRALSHFYLTNLFGDVPLAISTDYRINQSLARTTKATVYQQIITDLKESQSLLVSDYPGANNLPATDRIRPNKWAATALLARVYLYTGDWAAAETEATAVINNSSIYNLEPNLNNTFLKASKETIWQILPSASQINAGEGYLFADTANTPVYAQLSNAVVNAFEPGDKRKINWVKTFISGGLTYNTPYKYKVRMSATVSEYEIVLRFAEQYLIRAEARAKQNNIAGAQADINVIRSRAGIGNTTAADVPSLLSAVEQERKVELFAEWGHRWFDLKRTNRADAILSIAKSPNWQPTDGLYPVPLPDILSNSNLLPQNPGY